MKKYFFALSALFVISSCNNTQKLLCRAWHVNNIDFSFTGKNIDSTLKAQMIQRLKDSMVITFNPDHTYLNTGFPEGPEKGTWQMGATRNTVNLKNSKTSTLLTIRSINQTEMIADIAGKDSTNIHAEMAVKK